MSRVAEGPRSHELFGFAAESDIPLRIPESSAAPHQLVFSRVGDPPIEGRWWDESAHYTSPWQTETGAVASELYCRSDWASR